jgi:hypothetical protein
VNAADIIGYTYEADVHCLDCTAKRWNASDPAEFNGECFIVLALDNEGNTPSPVFAEGDNLELCCGDCGWRLDGEDNSIYTVTELAEGGIEREEYFVLYPLARATFDAWTQEAREYNNSDGDGVFLWDMALCRTVAEYTGHNGDGGSLVEFGV